MTACSARRDTGGGVVAATSGTSTLGSRNGDPRVIRVATRAGISIPLCFRDPVSDPSGLFRDRRDDRRPCLSGRPLSRDPLTDISSGTPPGECVKSADPGRARSVRKDIRERDRSRQHRYRRPRKRGGLTGMVLAELRQLAGELNIPDTAGMRKGDLIAAIKERQAGAGPARSSRCPRPLRPSAGPDRQPA